MKLKDLKTGAKLTLGFAVILMLTAILTYVGWNGFDSVKEQDSKLKMINDVQRNFILARLQTRSFLHTKQDSWSTQAIGSLDEAIKMVEDLKPKITIEQNKILIDELNKGLLEYKEILKNNIEVLKAQTKELEYTMIMGDRLESAFRSASLDNENGINLYFTKARWFVANYMTNTNTENISKANENIRIALNKSAGLKNDSIDAILTRYQQFLSTFEKTNQSIADLQNKQVEVGKIVTASSQKMVEHIEDFVNQTRSKAVSIMIIMAIVSIIIGIIMAYIITVYMTSMLKKGVELAQKYSQGELTYQIDSESLTLKDELGDLNRALYNMASKIKDIISSIYQGAENVASAGQQISSTTQQMSQGASEQASSVEEVSSSMEQMASNIQQNRDNSTQTETISNEAVAGMKLVNEAAGKSLVAIKNISEKISIINDIAFQTNILALNAAVEAARAGEHGKGFAVVAAEVRKLAERSKIAADEIVGLAKTSVDVTENAGRLMIDTIPKIEKTSKLVQEITASSLEQSTGAEQINNAIQQLNQVTQQNAASSEEMATSAEELASQAEQLKSIVAFFKIDNENHSDLSATKKKVSSQPLVHRTDNKNTIVNPKLKQGAHISLEKPDHDYERF